ncbi:MAG: thermonuclease family protein [Dehalococcoidia bacterium]|nr:thermonuclease family protein [Dehalococcoidia bacterium]
MNKLKRNITHLIPCLLALALMFSATACQPQAPTEAGTFQVIRVIDGDTIVVEGNVRVRYIGMNAPEMDEPFGEEAKEANQDLVQGKRVKMEKDVSNTDRYNRWLRYVYVDSLMVNGEIVRLGLARAQGYPPDIKHQAYLNRLEREASQAGRGIWAR